MKRNIRVLLLNTGSAKDFSYKSVREFLKNFLTDKRVIKNNSFFWKFLLHIVILNIRPFKVLSFYKEAYKNNSNFFLDTTKELAKKIEDSFFGENKINIKIKPSMLYSTKSISSSLKDLKNVDDLILFPLFPQYSATTSGASFDAVSSELKKINDLPNIHFIKDYCDNPLYIKALADSVKNNWKEKKKGEVLLISYHGLPLSYIKAGDSYQSRCELTTKLLKEELKESGVKIEASYQSRFGKEKWLTPYTDKKLMELAKRKVKIIDIICPGFSIDCLETLHEIEIENKKALKKYKVELRYIKALNASDSHAILIKTLLKERVLGL